MTKTILDEVIDATLDHDNVWIMWKEVGDITLQMSHDWHLSLKLCSRSTSQQGFEGSTISAKEKEMMKREERQN